MKRDNRNLPRIDFLEDVVDECAINGDVIANEMIFDHAIRYWNPKVI